MGRQPKFIALIMALLLFAGVAADAAAQQTGTVTVKVSERNGVIPRATVILVSADNNRSFRRVTSGEGVAVVENVPAGDYDLKVSFIGFADHQQKLEVKAGENSVDVTMTLSQFSETITITTANRREELLRNVAEPTTVIDETDLADTGGRSAKDVLLDQAGAGVLVNAGGGQGHVSINGVANKGVLILIDGRRWLGKNGVGDVNLEDLDMTQFERIEVIKGGGSAIYGSDALGGVINFISKKPKDGGFTNSLDFSYGSYKDTKVSDTVSFNMGDVRGAVFGGYRYFEGYDINPDNPQTQGLPESTFYNAGGNIEFLAHERITLRALADISRREIDKYYFSGFTQLGTQVYNSQREITQYKFSPEADITLADTTLLNLRYNYAKYNREETQVYPTRTTVLAPWQEWNNEFNATVNHGWNFLDQDQVLQAGYEFRNEKMDRSGLLTPDGATEAERDINVFWAQNEFNLHEMVKVTVGFRYDDYSDFGDEFSPKASIMIAPAPEHRLRASYGHGFRAPNFGELYLISGSFFRGNPDLEPEKSDNITVGYTYTDSVLQGSIDYFHNKVENGIEFFALTPFSYTYRNISEFTAKGINLSAAANLPYGFVPSFAYTYLTRENDEGEEIAGTLTHSGWVKLAWSEPRLGLRANTRVQFNDEVVYSDNTSQPAYQIWYAQIYKDLFNTGRHSVSAFVQVDNLLDEDDFLRRNASGEPIPGDFQIWLPPRTFRIGISIDFGFDKN